MSPRKSLRSPRMKSCRVFSLSPQVEYWPERSSGSKDTAGQPGRHCVQQWSLLPAATSLAGVGVCSHPVSHPGPPALHTRGTGAGKRSYMRCERAWRAPNDSADLPGIRRYPDKEHSNRIDRRRWGWVPYFLCSGTFENWYSGCSV